MIKKITKEITKLEQQNAMKVAKRNQLDREINEISSRLKELNGLKNQYEKLEKSTDSFFKDLRKGDDFIA